MGAPYGTFKIVTGTDPAPGAEISDTVPAGKYWALQSVYFSITADANAANRFINMIVDDGSVVVWNGVHGSSAGSLAITAGITREISASPFIGQGIQSASQRAHQCLPNFVWLPGWRFRTTTTAIQVGDNYSAPRYYVIEYNDFPWFGF